uniref:Uncharacterized protein n=1 Tax=Trichuris muris TaxID=70415 RepID=A0A5S6Q7X0_TRIMR
MLRSHYCELVTGFNSLMENHGLLKSATGDGQ